MFGLRNINGSCWVNATLQAIFRLPDVQARYDAFVFENNLDKILCRIWKSKGAEGLQDLFEEVRSDLMPAGRGIGDSHELLTYLCDKLPYLDKLCRFSMAHTIECVNCNYKNVRNETFIKFLLTDGQSDSISSSIQKTVQDTTNPDWRCEKCKATGCVMKHFIGSFPQYMIFDTPLQSSIKYCSILVLNKRKYALSSVVCYNGAHWWTYGRNMPPGSDWVIFDDTNVVNHGPKQFPLSNATRMLIYYCINE